MVNNLLKDELKEDFPHALSLVTKESSEFSKSDYVLEPSPNCKGGFGK